MIEREGRTVLTAASLRLPQGAVVALVGPNGSGKSTFLHAVAGLVACRRGELLVLGRPPDPASGRVAYVLQVHDAPAHLPVTVSEVVALARYRGLLGRPTAGDRAAVADVLDRLDLGDLRRRRLAELSTGQRQRVLIAQGLVQDAPILLLDEPLSGLDLVSADRIRQVAREEASGGRTVVAATHDLDDAAAADHAVLLAGRVVASGIPSSVLSAGSLRSAYGSRVIPVGDAELLLDDTGHHHPH